MDHVPNRNEERERALGIMRMKDPFAEKPWPSIEDP